MEKVSISASLQCANPLDMREIVTGLEKAGTDMLHIDLMDGSFVPNLALNFDLMRAVRGISPLPMDAHLMMARSADYLDTAIDSGAAWLCYHVENDTDHAAALAHIRARGAKAGLAISPDTPIEALLPHLPLLDYVLVMAVRPGFSGQSFLPDTLARVCALRQARERKGLSFTIAVDGGLDTACGRACAQAGAALLVGGAKGTFTPQGQLSPEAAAFAQAVREV